MGPAKIYPNISRRYQLVIASDLLPSDAKTLCAACKANEVRLQKGGIS